MNHIKKIIKKFEILLFEVTIITKPLHFNILSNYQFTTFFTMFYFSSKTHDIAELISKFFIIMINSLIIKEKC